MIRRRRRLSAAPILSLVVTSALVAGACSGPAPGPSSSPTTSTSLVAMPSAPRSPSETVPLDGFRSVTITVVADDGTTRTFCVLLADTDALREQGLMFVEDPSLGGRDGMLFVFAGDVDGSFWMRSTRLPLSIAYVRADGTTLATSDMEPCPDSSATCPTYPSGGTYRYAIEVPKGGLERLGIGAGSTVMVGTEPCDARGRGTPG